jgi:hypothetical protein
MVAVVPSSLALVLELLELRSAQVTHDDLLRTSRQVRSELMSTGLLVEGANLDSVTCGACDDDHAAEANFDADHGFRHYCHEAGW